MPNLSTLNLPTSPLQPAIPVKGVAQAAPQQKFLSVDSTGRVPLAPQAMERKQEQPETDIPKMTVAELGRMVKEKYPVYSEMDDEELGNNMLQKYPEYSSRVIMPEPKKPQASLVDQMKSVNPWEIGKGALKGIGSTALSIGQLGSSALESAWNATLGKATGIKAFKGAEDAQAMKESELMTRNNLGQKLGFGAEQLAEFFVPVPGGPEAKLLSKAGKVLENTPKLAKIAQAGIKTLSGGAEMGAKAYLQTGSKEEAEYAAKFGAGGALAGEILAPIASRLSNAIFYRTIPSTPTQIGKDIAKGLNIGKAVGETGISTSRGQLLSKLQKNISETGNRLGQAIDEAVVMNPRSVTTMDDITKRVRERIVGDKLLQNRMQLTPIELEGALNTVDDTLMKYNELYKGKELNVKDLQELKVSLGNGLEKEFQMALDKPIKAQKLTEMTLRGDLRKIIEQNVPLTSKLNQKLAPLNEASKRLAKKGAYSGYLTDIIVGGLAAGSPSDILNDPMDYFKRFTLGVIGKRVLTSTFSKTATATVLRDVDKIVSSPGFTQMLRKLLTEPNE